MSHGHKHGAKDFPPIATPHEGARRGDGSNGPRGGAGDKLERGLVGRARQVRHDAGEAYHRLTVWTRTLEDRLRSDFKETGLEAEVAWEKVRDTVKHAWERVTTTARFARSTRM